MRRPTMRLAYCTGMRRCDCSTNTTSAMTSTTIAMTTMNFEGAVVATRDRPDGAVGKLAAIDVKMSSDMPLPTPRSVMSSPSHMIRPVPAVMVMTMIRSVCQLSFGMTSTVQPLKS